MICENAYYKDGDKKLSCSSKRELDTLDKYFPLERKQCEIIWRPVYEEYRRIGYRLRPADEGRQMSIDEFLQEDTE